MGTTLKSLRTLVFAAAAFATAAGALGEWHWLLELFSHFRLQYVVILTSIALIYALQRRWGWVLVAVLLSIYNALTVASLFGSNGDSSVASSLVVASANLNSNNRRADAVLDLVREEVPDVLVLQEFTSRWAADLSALKETFPYHFELPQEDNFGLALYSRLPINGTEVIALGESSPALRTEIATAEGPLLLIAVHLRPPVSPARARERIAQFRHLATLATDRLPLVVVGDFNATPWSPHFKHWIEEAGLQSGQGRGAVAYTWPAQLPIFWIPIDGCVVSNHLRIIEQRRGSSIGSDHYPLITFIGHET